MRGKSIISRTCAIAGFACIYLPLILLVFGCKEKSEEAGTPEETREVTSAEPQKDVGVKEHDNQLVFDLREVSVFDLSEEVALDYLRGQMTFCDNRPDIVWPGRYPRFTSGQPLRGSITFGGNSTENSPPSTYYLAIDETGGTGTGYDRLYFDRNGDQDLTNDKPLMALKDPPKAALKQYSSSELQVCFESLELMLDFGSAGKHAVEIMARLMAQQQNPRLTFFATSVHKGEIEICGAKYDALLGYGYRIGMPFDQPGTVFHLIPKNDPQSLPRWWGADQLNSTHDIGGKYYRFAATPLGDKLFARPYTGKFGTFEVGRGGRNIQEVSVQGSLRSKDTAVAVADCMEHGWPKPTKSCRLPEGDYLPAIMTLTLDRLRVSISDNYHSDGKPRGRDFSNRTYGMRIREHKPFILDLSNKPNVLFASPAQDKRVKLGAELEVKAVLIDPELDVMIRGLDDTNRKQKKEFSTPDGRTHTTERPVSLDPKVIITRADGEKVTEGVMPFG